jgi:endonuclease-3
MGSQGRHIRALNILRREYSASPETSLYYGSAFQLLVATILSAQCTDLRVNKVTAVLFKRYKTPKDFASMSQACLERQIRSTGFFRNKAKNIRAASAMIVREYGGRVPQSMEELVRLPGVARKTANIVLTAAFGKVEGIAVDTHVQRLARRIGLADSEDPVKVERQLMALYPRKKWPSINRLLVSHGRAVCKARKPLCEKCKIEGICPKIGVVP